MPLYTYKCPTCGRGRDVFKAIADIDRKEECSNCGFAMNRQVAAPAVRGDYAGYTCPVTGAWIEGRRAHKENLARQGCRVLEPGETEAVARRRQQEDAALDSKIEATVEQFFETLPTEKKERLANEVASGADVQIVRN